MVTLQELTELFNTGGIEAIHAHLLTHTRPDMGAVVEALITITPFLTHKEDCEVLEGLGWAKCSCGLDQALAALKAGGAHEKH